MAHMGTWTFDFVLYGVHEVELGVSKGLLAQGR